MNVCFHPVPGHIKELVKHKAQLYAQCYAHIEEVVFYLMYNFTVTQLNFFLSRARTHAKFIHQEPCVYSEYKAYDLQRLRLLLFVRVHVINAVALR